MALYWAPPQGWKNGYHWIWEANLQQQTLGGQCSSIYLINILTSMFLHFISNFGGELNNKPKMLKGGPPKFFEPWLLV
jgi:hypothetical protein